MLTYQATVRTQGTGKRPEVLYSTHLICQNLGRNLSAVPRWRGVVGTDDFLLHTGEYRVALLCCFADDVDCPDALTIEAHVLRERLAHDGVHTLHTVNKQPAAFVV
jgi:hypothetical protein